MREISPLASPRYRTKTHRIQKSKNYDRVVKLRRNHPFKERGISHLNRKYKMFEFSKM